MKKRIAALLVGLCVALTVAPGLAFALGDESQAGDSSSGGLHSRSVEAVHIDGQNGNDSNSGEDASTAVRTIAKAAELAGEGGTIVVDGSVVIDEKIDLNNLVIERGDNMKGILLSVRNEVSLTNVTIDGKNIPDVSGYLVSSLKEDGHLIINDGCKLINNQETAVRVMDGGTLTMNGGEISNNKATSAWGMAGAIDLDECEVYLNGGVIEDNQAYYAGAVRVGGHGGYCELNGTIIRNNTGGYGGAFFVQGMLHISGEGAPPPDANLFIKSGEVSGNEAITYGGAICAIYNGYETNVEISGGVIKDNTCVDNPATSAVYLATTTSSTGACDFAVSGSPTIEGSIYLMQATGRVSAIRVADEFTPTSPLQLYSTALAEGSIAVRYDNGVPVDPKSFASEHEDWGLGADGQTLVWRQLKSVSFESADGSATYGSAYADADGYISESDVPVPQRAGCELAGWKLEGASNDELWDFENDKVDSGGVTLVAVWKLSAPTVTIDASVTSVHEGSNDTFELEAKPGHVLDNVSFSYVWLRDGVVVEGATTAKLTTDVPGSYTVHVTASGNDVLASDGAESAAVLCSVEPHEAATWSSDESSHWKVCATCGTDFEHAEHSWGEWTIVQKPEANAEGKRERTCSICGFVASETISALGDESSEDGLPETDGKEDESSKESLPETGDGGFAPFAALGAASLLMVVVSAVMRRRSVS